VQNTDKLLAKLIENVKGKSVYTNLKSIANGKCKDKIEEAKGISSAITHCLIEHQKDPQYKPLIASLFEKLGQLLYEL